MEWKNRTNRSKQQGQPGLFKRITKKELLEHEKTVRLLGLMNKDRTWTEKEEEKVS